MTSVRRLFRPFVSNDTTGQAENFDIATVRTNRAGPDFVSDAAVNG